MFNTVQDYLALGKDFLYSSLASVQTYVPAPINNAVSSVAKVVFHKYAFCAYGTGATAFALLYTADSIFVRNGKDQKIELKPWIQIKNGLGLDTIKKVVAPALAAIAFFAAARR